jgi:hypothetical protein
MPFKISLKSSTPLKRNFLSRIIALSSLNENMYSITSIHDMARSLESVLFYLVLVNIKTLKEKVPALDSHTLRMKMKKRSVTKC